MSRAQANSLLVLEDGYLGFLLLQLFLHLFDEFLLVLDLRHHIIAFFFL